MAGLIVIDSCTRFGYSELLEKNCDPDQLQICIADRMYMYLSLFKGRQVLAILVIAIVKALIFIKYGELKLEDLRGIWDIWPGTQNQDLNTQENHSNWQFHRISSCYSLAYGMTNQSQTSMIIC